MIMDNTIFQEDLNMICNCLFISWEDLKNKTVFITGGTGLIGTTLVNAFVKANEDKKLNMKIIALVRSIKKAEERFPEASSIEIVRGDVLQIPNIQTGIDFVIHAASQTSSKEFSKNPVETTEVILKGTRNVLELAKEKNVKSMIFLSTMEVYGYPKKGHKISENEIGSFDVTNPRNCYPIGKIMAENLCCSYFNEYDVPIHILRLTQTFGPGVEYNDNRVFAEFARCAIEKKTIVLKTMGETERCYLYNADAVTAIVTVLLKGNPGEIYNVANEETYCSIAEMAEVVAKENGIQVKYEQQDIKKFGYANTLFIDLNTEKIRALGWNPSVDLMTMYNRLIESLRI